MLTVSELRTKEQTGQEMYDLIDKYHSDLETFRVNGQPIKNLPLPVFYNMIRAIPFKKDISGIEIVSRPYHILDAPWRGWDCKKKAIVVGSYLKNHNIPYRLKAVSRRPDRAAHHVFPEAWIDGQWVSVDATYPRNKLFETVPWTNTEILPEGQGNGTYGNEPILVSMYGSDPVADAAAFNQRVNAIAPELLGEPATIIAAIISAVVAVAATVIGAVSSKRSQERAQKFESQLIAAQSEAQQEIIEEAADAQQQKTAQLMQLSNKMIVPGMLALGLLFLARSK